MFAGYGAYPPPPDASLFSASLLAAGSTTGPLTRSYGFDHDPYEQAALAEEIHTNMLAATDYLAMGSAPPTVGPLPLNGGGRRGGPLIGSDRYPYEVDTLYGRGAPSTGRYDNPYAGAAASAQEFLGSSGSNTLPFADQFLAAPPLQHFPPLGGVRTETAQSYYEVWFFFSIS